MSSLSRASHEHHDRLMPHVDRLAQLGDMLGESVPPGFGEACEAEHRFITGQLLPHIEAIETTLYGELDRLMQGRHSMAPMRREHAELRRLIDSMGDYHELLAQGRTRARRGDRASARALPAACDAARPSRRRAALPARAGPEPIARRDRPARSGHRARHRRTDVARAGPIGRTGYERDVRRSVTASRYRASNSPMSRARSFITAAHSSSAA